MEVNREINKQIAALKKRHETHVFNLILEEAKKFNPYKVGDIVEDHYQIGKIRTVNYQISLFNNTFGIVYTCEKLKKNLTPFKSGEMTNVWFRNIKKQHN